MGVCRDKMIWGETKIRDKVVGILSVEGNRDRLVVGESLGEW